MILTCPECNTRYLADASAIGVGGRRVRCTKCAHEWRQTPDLPGDAALEPEAADDARFPAETAPPPILPRSGRIRPLPRGSNLPALTNKSSSGRYWAGWAVLVLVLAAGTASAVVWREAVVTHWPPAGRLYDLVSLPVSPPEVFAFDIRDVASKIAFEAGQRVLKVSGQVINIGAEAKSVPRLRVTIVDDANRTLHDWTVAMPTKALGPGESTPFTTRLPNPPENVKRISVTFEA